MKKMFNSKKRVVLFLVALFVILTISGTSAKRIVEVLDEVPDLDNNGNEQYFFLRVHIFSSFL